MKSTKSHLLKSALAMLLCISMLVGSTFAWFTDRVTSAGNIIQSGNLKIDMQWAETYDGENTVWNDAEGVDAKPVFDYDQWEPGYTVVRYIKISNLGDLAFKYQMNIIPTGEVGVLAEVIDVQYDIVTDNDAFAAPAADNKQGSLTTVGTLGSMLNSATTVASGVLLPANEEKEGLYSGEIVACVSLHMQELAGNMYQGESIGDAFAIQLLATQYTYENDSFGNLYDLLADSSIYVTQSKTLDADATAVEFSITHSDTVIAKLRVPASAIADAAEPVTVTFDGIDPTETIVVGANTKSYAYDIKVTNLKESLSGDQLITVVLTAPNALPAAKLYHNGMLIENAVYDEVTGTITFKTDSFSPYAVSWKEKTAGTAAELRECITGDDDVYIKLTADITFNCNEGTEGFNGDEKHMAKSTAYNYAYYNGVNISGKNVAVDLNGHSMTAFGNVGAVFFVLPDSSLNITDSVGGGTITAKDPCYVIWAPYDDPSFCDIYDGIFVTDAYAGVTDPAKHTGAIVYAGEGGTINIYGGYYLYNNTPDDAKNTNNGAFNVMDGNIYNEDPCITVYDGVMLINEHYRQSTGTDDTTVKLAENCAVVPVTLSTPVKVNGVDYRTWYQVQTTQPTRFETVFENTDKYTYRVGNQNPVALGSLFKTNNAISDGAVIEVTVTGNNVSGTYTEASNATKWAEGTIKFEGTGLATVTINGCKLTVEVVDAVNATSATNAENNNVVLLNDCGFSTLEVSGGYTLYGNGFTMTCGRDSAVLDMGYAFVTLDNGTLDNVQIICPNFDYAVLYKSNLTSSQNRSETTDKTRYYNARSGVMASGNSQILNSRISGGRASLNVSGGNVLVDNSRIELGAVATILVGSANKLTLRDTTLIQKPAASTYDSSKSLMGFSVLYLCDAAGNATPTTIEGSFVQQAWIDESDARYVPSAGKSIVTAVLKEKDYLHDIDGDGENESLNLGFAYMPEELDSSVAKPTNITDNRTDKATVPYEMKDVSVRLAVVSTTVYVYSYKNTSGTDDSFKNEDNYKPNTQSDNITVSYSDTAEGLTAGKSFGTDGWVYELNVDLDKVSGYALDFSKLAMSVNGTAVTDFKVNGSAKPTAPIAVTAGGTTYTLTATVNGKEYTATYKVTGTETTKESPSLVASNYGAGLCVASSAGGTWHGAAPALEGIQIRYWSVAEKQYKTINLADYTPTTNGKLNGTNTTWTYSPDNGDFTLTLTGGQVHSSNNVYAMPVVCDGKLYFVASKSNGLVNTGNGARTIPVSYVFEDNNNGTPLKFSHTWSVAENKEEQYKYSDFCNGTLTPLTSDGGGGGTCLAEGTLITLANGTKKAIEDLRKGDSVMAFDHITGKVTQNDVIIVVKTQSDFYKNTFVFDDGSELITINEHGIYDLNLQKYVNIDHANFRNYIGHNFVSIDARGRIGTKKLVDVVSLWTTGYKYDIVTDQTLNYVAEDTLSVTHVLVDVINTFEFDRNMRYDQRKMHADIQKYGLYAYDEWEQYCEITVFEQYNIPVMKVGISKGLYTKEYIIGLINTYVLDESVQIID